MTDEVFRRQAAVVRWLLVVCVLLFLMIVLGGLTRLTESGLSIVEWKPLTGWIPPFGDAAWQELFQKYRASPEYQKITRGMTLDQFKGIFWLEFVHRLWGRLIGFAFAVPLAVFWWRGWLDRQLKLHLIVALLLGASQGALGWLMVASGLVDDPRVSPYRLAAHFGLGVFIYGYLFWLATGRIDLARQVGPGPGDAVVRRRAFWIVGLVAVTMLSGALVAGLDAGRAYNTFPFMAGRIVPDGYFALGGTLGDMFENIAAVQFNHRALATLTLLIALGFGFHARRTLDNPRLWRAILLVAVAAAVQYVLGVLTLLTHVQVALGAAHQATAVILFTALLWAARIAGVMPAKPLQTPAIQAN
jgi:cytochrome c oxidase assembly protein subunit 15